MKSFFYTPWFSDLEHDYKHQENMGVQPGCGYHAGVGELLACQRESRITVGTYCDSKDDDLLDTEKVVVQLPRVTCKYRQRGHLTQNSCTVKPCARKCADCNDYCIYSIRHRGYYLFHRTI